MSFAGRTDDALGHFEAALEIARGLGNRRFESNLLGYLSNLHRDQGKIEEAVRHYQDALAIHREVGNRPFEGTVLGNLGRLHSQQGRLEQAREVLAAGEAIEGAVL